MRNTLTPKSIEALKPNPTRRYEVRDQLLPGFGVRVSTNGKKTWFAVGRCRGKQIRHTIGSYPTISLKEAREAARLVLKDLQLGDYGPTREAPPQLKLTFGAAVNQFIALYAKPKNRSWKATAATLRKFSCFDEKPIDEITRQDVVRILDQIAAAGMPIAANRALSAIKKLFAWSFDRGSVPSHPLIGLRKPGIERSRDRVLTENELRAFWAATEELNYPFGAAFRLMLLTGQRRGEVTCMRWSQLDLVEGIWKIPASVAKNGRAHAVPLSSQVVAIISGLPRFSGSDFVFTTTGSSPISGFGRTKRRLDDVMLANDWRLHDLRRTAASGMARLGVQPHVIEKVLNHVSGEISGVAAVYNRHGYEAEKRTALSLWSDHLFQLVLPRHDNIASTKLGESLWLPQTVTLRYVSTKQPTLQDFAPSMRGGIGPNIEAVGSTSRFWNHQPTFGSMAILQRPDKEPPSQLQAFERNASTRFSTVPSWRAGSGQLKLTKKAGLEL